MQKKQNLKSGAADSRVDSNLDFGVDSEVDSGVKSRAESKNKSKAESKSAPQINIFLNGKPMQTSAKDSLEFLEILIKDSSRNDATNAPDKNSATNATNATSAQNTDNLVYIINGFATKEAVVLKEGDELFLIKKGEMPPQDALESMMSARHTPKVHERLKRASVAICGLGGLGSHIAIMLARVGVGRLRLIDFDIIEPSNLNRQAYSIDDLGAFKADALSAQIARINPFIATEPLILKITKDNLAEALAGANIVCEAFDVAATKAMLAQHFHAIFPDTPLICASGLAGFGDSNDIITKKIAPNFYVCGDMKSGAKVGMGLMAPRVSICAAHQANLVLELLMQNS